MLDCIAILSFHINTKTHCFTTAVNFTGGYLSTLLLSMRIIQAAMTGNFTSQSVSLAVFHFDFGSIIEYYIRTAGVVTVTTATANLHPRIWRHSSLNLSCTL